MIIIQELPREGSVAQELRAIEDKRKEETPLKNNSKLSYWMTFVLIITVLMAVVLL